MAAKLQREKVPPVESTTYRHRTVRTKNPHKVEIRNVVYETEMLLLVGEFASLSLKQIIVRLCHMKGPWTPDQFQTEIAKLGRKVGISTLYAALRDLKKFGALVKVNGGYAIVGWDK